MRSILTAQPADYQAQWDAFDAAALYLELTPYDRWLAWRERTGNRDLYEWPVPISHFLRSPFYMGGEVNVRDPIMDVLVDYMNPHQLWEILILIAGFGAGKSFSATLKTTYVAYQLSCIRRTDDGGPGPHRYLSRFPAVDLDSKTEIGLATLSAAGARQAKNVIFSDVASKLEHAPYFHHREAGFEPYATKTELQFPGRIRFAFGTSQARSIIGLNLYWIVIDEAAFAESDESDRVNVGSVKAQFEQANGRRQSRFGRLGGVGLYTSPNTEQAYVELLAGEEAGEVLVRRLKTWEAKGELVPGAEVFLLDEDPERPRVVEDGPLIYVAPGLAQRPGSGELVRFGPLQPGERRAREVLRDEALRGMVAGGGVAP